MRLVPDPGGTAYTLVVRGTPQSHVDLADPTRLEFEYVQRIADLLDAVAPPGARITAVHVGGAGLTLPRYVACTRPGSNQVVLEPDVALTALVRDRLPLPRASGIKVRAVDGAGGMATVRDALADVVVVDAFVEARVPAQLTTTGFLAQVRRVLRPAGVAVLNVTDRAPFGYTRRVLAGARTVFTDVAMSAEAATLKGRRFGNVLSSMPATTPSRMPCWSAAPRAPRHPTGSGPAGGSRRSSEAPCRSPGRTPAPRRNRRRTSSPGSLGR